MCVFIIAIVCPLYVNNLTVLSKGLFIIAIVYPVYVSNLSYQTLFYHHFYLVTIVEN